jgi:flagellar basal-body rod modification protein FlgD
MSVTAQDASGQPVAVSTLATGVVDSVDLTKNPPLLSVNGQTFTVNQVQGVSRN